MIDWLSKEWASAIAAIISAFAGLIAAYAASCSAKSAGKAQLMAEAIERHNRRRQIAISASDVLLEADRVESQAVWLRQAYTTLFTFAGGTGSSREAHYKEAIDRKVALVKERAESAKRWISLDEGAKGHQLKELVDAEIKLAQALSETRAVRLEFEQQFAHVEAQNNLYRQKAINPTARS